MKKTFLIFLLAVVNLATAQLSNCNNQTNVGTLKACSVYVNKRATVAGDVTTDSINGLRFISDESNTAAIRLNTRTLVNLAGNRTMIDWEQGYLQYPSTSLISVDWVLGDLYGSSATRSFNWANRIAYNSAGNACFNYSSSSNGIGISNVGTTHSAFLKNTYLTANRTIQFPDSSGRLALTNSNVASATVLQNPRNINGVSFNGSSDITVTSAAGTLTGTTLAANITNSSINTINSGIGNGILQTTGGAGAISVKNTTGSGDIVLNTSPTFVTPILGAATATSLTIPSGTANGFLKANGTIDSSLVQYTNGRFTETSISKWRAAVSRQRAGGTPAKIAFYGSSTTYSLFQSAPLETNNYPYRVRQFLSSWGQLGEVYEGEVWFTKYQAAAGGATAIDSRMTIGAGWVTDANGFGAGGYAIGNNTDNSELSFNSVVNCTGFTVTYVTNPTFATFTWAIDGGSTTVVDASTSTGTAVLTISGLSLAPHTLTIRLVVNGTKRVIISNIRIDDSNRPAGGIHVTHCGINGSTTALWSANNGHGGSSLPLAFTRTAPDLAVIQLGVNDAVNAVSTSTFYTNYKAIVSYAKSVNCDVVLMVPHPPDPTFTNLSTWQTYVVRIYQIAKELDCSVIDMQQRWPSYATGNASPYSYYADQIHASNRGYWDIATAAFSFIKKTE